MGRRAGTGNSLPRCSGVTGPDTDVARVAAGQRAMCFARRVAEPYGSTARTQSSSQSGRGGVVTPRPVAGLPTCFTSFADKTCKPCLFPSRSACPSRYKPRACHRDCAQERRRPYAAFGAAGPPPVVLLRSKSTSGLSLGAVFYLMRHADTDWPLVVEFDLHEWVPDLTYRWTTPEQVLALIENMRQHGGEWPSTQSQPAWEPMSAVRQRSLGVLARYASATYPIAAVTHGGVVESLTGRSVGLTEIVPYEFPSPPA